MPGDLTTEILVQIRDEIRNTNERLDKTNERLDATRSELGERIDVTNVRLDRLEKRQTESEIRLATEPLAAAVREVRDLLKEDRATRDAVERHETRMTDLEKRVTAVERKVG